MNRRRFDWEEAQRLYWEGVSLRELAERFSVNVTSVRRVVIPGEMERLREKQRKSNQQPMPCVRCGDSLTRKAWLAGSRLCVECVNRNKVTTVRADTLQCQTCRRWKRDSEFYVSSMGRHWYRRNRLVRCKSCTAVEGRERSARARSKNV